MYPEQTECPRCGRRTITRRDGIFRWRACPATKACGWDVFNHGDDPRDRHERGDANARLLAVQSGSFKAGE